MITDALLGVVYFLLNLMMSWFPATSSCALSGLSSTGSYLAGIVYVTKPFFPWGDVITMLGMLLAIMGIKLAIQVFEILWP